MGESAWLSTEAQVLPGEFLEFSGSSLDGRGQNLPFLLSIGGPRQIYSLRRTFLPTPRTLGEDDAAGKGAHSALSFPFSPFVSVFGRFVGLGCSNLALQGRKPALKGEYIC